MRRRDIVIAGVFVILGLLCLLTASGVWMSGPLGMIVTMHVSTILIIMVLAIMALTVYLTRAFSQGSGHDLRCAYCGRSLQPAWQACPHCGERMKSQDGT